MTSRDQGYRLAIDYGTTNSGAAIADLPGLVAEVVRVNGEATIPSLVVLRQVPGHPEELLAGRAAEQSAGAYPGSVAWTPKRGLGRVVPLIRIPREVTPVEAVATTIELLLREATALRGHAAPAEVVLTHPAKWATAGTLQQALVQAARTAGIGADIPIGLLSEPVAAALRFHAREAIAPGDFVAVYDLGAGTFDTAILERTDTGFQVHGRPGGDDGIGGELFDDILAEYMMAQLEPDDANALRESVEPEWVDARRRFRASVRGAKEALSANTAGADVIHPRAGHPPLWLTGDELNEQLRPELAKTIDLLEQTINDAGLEPKELRSIYLTGGSSKIPLVGDLIQQRLGVVGGSLDDRKQVVALGAAGAPADAIEWDRPLGSVSERDRLETARLAEAARQAEAARLAEAARQAEAARLAEAARQAEAARLAEAARQAEKPGTSVSRKVVAGIGAMGGILVVLLVLSRLATGGGNPSPTLNPTFASGPTDAPVTEAPPTDAPATEAPPTEAPTEAPTEVPVPAVLHELVNATPSQVNNCRWAPEFEGTATRVAALCEGPDGTQALYKLFSTTSDLDTAYDEVVAALGVPEGAQGDCELGELRDDFWRNADRTVIFGELLCGTFTRADGSTYYEIFRTNADSLVSIETWNDSSMSTLYDQFVNRVFWDPTSVFVPSS